MEKIVAFGYHDQQAPRHWNVCKTLSTEGSEIIECHTTVHGIVRKYIDLSKKYENLEPKTYHPKALLVTFPGHFIMPLAWILTRFPRKKLIFDAFISLYDTNACDRKRVAKWHPKALLWYLADWFDCHLADEILIDTEEHKKYFVHTFHLRPEKIRVIYLGTRNDLFFPKARSSKLEARSSFNVLFYGTYIPLQGIEHIIEAAEIIGQTEQRIHFTLVGKGQTYLQIQELVEKKELQNVTFMNPVSYKEIPNLIRGADLCLGIFGTSAKAQRVIPHKVYDAVACEIPIITADTPAIREKFAHHERVILCKAGNANELARKILSYFTSRKSPIAKASKPHE